MKKILTLIFTLFSLGVLAQNQNLKKIEVVDQNHNTIRHTRLYSFMTDDRQPTNLSKVWNGLHSLSGVIKLTPTSLESGSSYRLAIEVDDKIILKNSKEIKKIFEDNGFQLVNIPTADN